MTRWLGAALGSLLLSLAGCQCAQLPEALFACEEDAGCGQPGYVCDRGASLCRPADAGPPDAGPPDAGPPDAGPPDAGPPDAGPPDAGPPDAGPPDAGPPDAGPPDAGPPDAGCLAFDLPDDDALDSNCDGLDGDKAAAAFVDGLGDDSNPGTVGQPYRTLGRALQSGKPQILVAEGTYAEALAFGSGRIWGGYRSDAGWARDGGAPVVDGTVIIDWDGGLARLDTLSIRAPAAADAGLSSVALTIRNADLTTVIHRVHLAAGRGGDGVSGADGGLGASGLPGGAGSVGGPDGGQAGPGGVPADCGGSSSGGGWPGGAGARTTPGDGASGEDPTLGGPGGAHLGCELGLCTGNDGGAGALDAQALMGGNGDAGLATGSIAGLSWVPLSGSPGTPGAHGKGGGGGGGGGGFLDLMMRFFGVGGGGGGGGSGGCGARGGRGGQGGGASLALLLIDASPTLTKVVLAPGRGGNGGEGGAAGLPGLGGPGAPGAAGEFLLGSTAGSGGPGADGQPGGASGPGGGGAGGPTVGLWCVGTSAPATPDVTHVTGVLAGGGLPNGPPGLLLNQVGCP